MARWADIRSRVQQAVGDITETAAQNYVLDAAQELNAEARWYEALLTVGTTTQGVGEYDISDAVIDVYSVLVGGVPYEVATTKDIEEIDAGVSTLTPGSRGQGAFAAGYTSTGDLRVSVRPVPSMSGVSVAARVILPVVVGDWAAASPPWPVDFDQVCVKGAIALGLAEQDERLESSAYHQQAFDKGVRRLRSRKSGRVGKGGFQMPLRRGVR